MAIAIKTYEEDANGLSFIELMIQRMNSRRDDNKNKVEDAKLKQSLLELLISIMELGYHRHYFRPIETDSVLIDPAVRDIYDTIGRRYQK